MGILTASSHYFRVGAHMAASQTLPSLKKTRQGQISIRFCSSDFHLKYANEMKIWLYQRNQVLPHTKLIARMKLVQAQKIRERGNKVKSEVNASIYTNLVWHNYERLDLSSAAWSFCPSKVCVLSPYWLSSFSPHSTPHYYRQYPCFGLQRTSMIEQASFPYKKSANQTLLISSFKLHCNFSGIRWKKNKPKTITIPDWL